MVFRNILEERISDMPGFFTKNLRRMKYAVDSILEPSLVGLGAASLALNATNIPLDKFLEGDPKSVLYAAGIGALGATSAFVEAKKGYIRNFMKDRFRENIRKGYPRKRNGVRPTPQDPGLSGWLKTTAITGLVYMLTAPSTNIPIIDKTLNHPGNIPSSYGRLESNVEEIWGRESIYGGRENGSTVVEVPKSIDGSKITAIDAEIYRMTISKKTKMNLGKGIYRYEKYKNIIKEAYKKNNLAELGINYELFAGLLAHESNGLDPFAVSYLGAAGIGQQMPWVAKELGRNAFTYKGYQADQKAYAHKLKILVRDNKKSLDKLKKVDNRFDAKESIHMAAEWLAMLRRNNQNEEPNIAILRYNTAPYAIDFAKDRASKALGKNKDSVSYNELRHYLIPEGEKFSIKVNAMAEVLTNPQKYGITPVKVPW